MKTLIPFVAALACLWVGCGQSEAPPPAGGTNAAAAPGSNPLNAPADYLGGMVKAKKTAEKTVDTASLNKAVQLFYATEGRYPKDLNELVTTKYLPLIPEAPSGMKITYNASSGEVKVVAK